jgi:hypothetical protein
MGGLIPRHSSESEAGHAAHVLSRTDPVETAAFGNPGRGGVLQANPLDVRVGVRSVDLAEKLPGGGGLW